MRHGIERPVFIVSTPRSGSTLLFEILSQAPEIYTIGTESHALIERFADFQPRYRAWDSNRLTAADAGGSSAEALVREFYANLRDRDGQPPSGAARMLEKTPKNALRVPFFDAVFPDATFLYLYRDVRQSLASMMEAWASGGFRTYPQLPGWTGYPWSLLLVPAWQQLVGQPLPVVVAHQWATTTSILLDDLQRIPRERVCVLTYDELVANPQSSIAALAAKLDFNWDRTLDTLPLSKATVSRPSADKWRRLEQVIAQVLPIVSDADSRAKTFVEKFS